MTAEHLASGEWGEKKAEQYLRRKGYRIIGRRVRIGKRDEIDLVARKQDVLVFVEVKTRRSVAFGRPVSAVDRNKRRLLSRAAVHYLSATRFRPVCFRFDVVEVIGSPADDATVRHIENAFPLDSRYDLPF